MVQDIYVDADWSPGQRPQTVGCLSVDVVRGKESYSFEYDSEWIALNDAISLDPDLQLFEGKQYPSVKRSPSFGIFLDSAPDRWGRLLMQRREAFLAREQNRAPKRLLLSDYLLGVHDEQRLGGLRLRLEPGESYQSADPDMAAPPWASLRELEQASWTVQSNEPSDDRKTYDLLRMLLAPGSSIGGARPKAGVVDEEHNLWIAKFPARDDDREIGAWEYVAMELAKRSGINVPPVRLERFGKRKHRSFLIQRFDRVVSKGTRNRIHFASAMTMLGREDGDGDGASTGVSYLDLAQWIVQHQRIVDEDLQQLWRRIVFSILIRNTDDHLRNHGFLLTDQGWRLSPAYDLNPEPLGVGLSLNVSELDNTLSLDLAREVAPNFRVDAKTSDSIIAEVGKAVKQWRQVSKELGIARGEIDQMANAFIGVP